MFKKKVRGIDANLLIVIVVAVIAILMILSNFKKETTSLQESESLTDFQIQACNSANEAGTCQTRLPEVGIVLAEDCCEALGKCC